MLLVDGHSAIFQSKELNILHAQKALSARHRLTQLLGGYSDITGIHVVIVFDGQGPRLSEEYIQSGMQIFYSKKNQTADSVIERLVAKYSSHYHIRVATDDFLERQTIESFGGNWLSILQLFAEVQEAEENLNQRLYQLRHKK